MSDVTVNVTVLPNGPLFVAGDLDVLDIEGRPLDAPGSQIYLCRCGMSANKPFCDGSHARSDWSDRSAVERSAAI